MKNLVCRYALFALLLFPLIAQAEDSYIAKIKAVEGSAVVQHKGQDSALAANGSLYEGDVVSTRNDGYVSIVFIDGTQLSVGPKSNLVINRYLFAPKNKKYAFDLNIRKGSAIYSSGRLAKLAPEAVNVHTPQTTIGVRGTKFLVEVK